jgi:hypothetical protein
MITLSAPFKWKVVFGRQLVYLPSPQQSQSSLWIDNLVALVLFVLPILGFSLITAYSVNIVLIVDISRFLP